MGNGVLIVLGALAVLSEPAGPPARTVPSAAVVAGCLANWDADPQEDGIRALVALRDRQGRPVAVPPGAQATFSLRPVATHEGFTIERGAADPTRSPAPPIRWTVRLAPGKSPQAVNLPWRTPPPDAVRARLEVRLSVPTAGVFEARSLVRLDGAGFLDTSGGYR